MINYNFKKNLLLILLIFNFIFIGFNLIVFNKNIKLKKENNYEKLEFLILDYANFIKIFEGFSRKEYICPAGIKTIGHGHTELNKKYKIKKIDEELSLLLLKYRVLIIFLDCKYTLFKDLNLQSNEYKAIISLIDNIGLTKFQKTKLILLLKKYFKENRNKIYKKEIETHWNSIILYRDYKTGKLLKSSCLLESKKLCLQKRRKEEIQLFFNI